MSKKVLTVKLKPERNEFVQGMRFRKSGAHGKTKKAERRKEKVAFRKKMLTGDTD